MEDVSKIIQTDHVSSDKPGSGFYTKQRQRRKKQYKAARKHFDTLSKMVDEAHQELETSNSPFRLCVFEENGEIYIEVVVIDKQGKTRPLFRHDISHADVENLIHHIKSGRGLILDSSA